MRARLGIERHGPGVVGAAVSVLIDANLGDRVSDRRSGLYRLSGLPGGTLAAVDNDRRWLLIYGYDPAVEPHESFTDSRFRELARQAIGDPALEVAIVGHRYWQPTALVSDSYRRGRIFLAGDAAHVTTPIGGLGMNCGIGDVDNLAWKLAGVISGWADETVLDTYQPERQPVAELTVEASLGRARPPAPVDGLVLGMIYESDAICTDGTAPPEPQDPVGDYIPVARPGHRAPHMWLDDDNRTSTLDLFGDTFALLTGPEGSAWRLTPEAETGVPLRVHEIADGRWQKHYGIGPDGAVLVRPDGHVAWRAVHQPSTPTDLSDALNRAVGHA
jgi:putative polyketide hydroxylase